MSDNNSSQYLTVSDRVTLHYTDHPAQSDQFGVVVFVHGSGPGASGWSNFKHNVAAFQSAGYRCIVFDQPGYGLSSKPTDVDHTLDFFVAQLNALIEHIHVDQVTMVGNSLGGAVALGAAAAYKRAAACDGTTGHGDLGPARKVRRSARSVSRALHVMRIIRRRVRCPALLLQLR